MQYIDEKRIKELHTDTSIVPEDIENILKNFNDFIMSLEEKERTKFKSKEEKYKAKIEKESLDIAVYVLKGYFATDLLETMFNYSVEEFENILDHTANYIESMHGDSIIPKELKDRIVNGRLSINLREINGVTPKNIPLSALNF